MTCRWCGQKECITCKQWQGDLNEKEFEIIIFRIVSHQFIIAFNQIIIDSQKRAKVLYGKPE